MLMWATLGFCICVELNPEVMASKVIFPLLDFIEVKVVNLLKKNE